MKFATTVLLATSVAGANIDLAIENMSADELDMMAQHLREASAAKAMAVKQPDCSEKMMHGWDKFVAWAEATDAKVHEAVVAKGKAYPAELDEFEKVSGHVVDEIQKHAKADLSDAKLAKTRAGVDEFFAKTKAGLKHNIALERKWSAKFFKAYGVAYDAGYKVWTDNKAHYRKTVNALAESAETLGEKHMALKDAVKNTPQAKAFGAAFKDVLAKLEDLKEADEDLKEKQ